MDGLIERLRFEADERRKDPEWFAEEFSQAIVSAADQLEAKDKLISELVEALELVSTRCGPRSSDGAVARAVLSKAKEQ